jgi:hypothetical protein
VLVGFLGLGPVVAQPVQAATDVRGISLTGNGYVTVDGAGHVSAFGVRNRGNPSGFSGSIVGISGTRDGSGYAAISSTGQVYAYGSVVHRGNPAGFSGTIVGISVTGDGRGYVAISSKGQVHAYGTARHRGNPSGFSGSIAAVSVTADGQGYAAISTTGQVYAYGTVRYRGNPAGFRGLISGFGVTADGQGYVATSSYGQVYAYGTVRSFPNPYDFRGLARGMSVTPDGSGSVVLTDGGLVHSFGSVQYRGDADNVAIQDTGQHLNAARYVDWTYPQQGFWNVDQTVWVVQKAPSTYWSSNWSWTTTHGAATGGYMGIQTNGIRFDGTTGDTAIFSLWGANGTRSGQCDTFGGEGTGLSCRMPYTIYGDGNSYRLRVWRLESDAHGQWWGAWIRDSRRGDLHIGDIRVPGTSGLMTGPNVFAEYFGPRVGCDAVPRSIVNWNHPAYNGSVGTASFASSTKSSCVGGSAAAIVNGDGTRAVRTTLGGIRPGAT